MFCTKCGSQVSDDSQFCTNCGAQLSPITASPETPRQPDIQPKQQNTGSQQPAQNAGWQQGVQQPMQNGWQQPAQNAGWQQGVRQPMQNGWQQPAQNAGWQQGVQQPMRNGWQRGASPRGGVPFDRTAKAARKSPIARIVAIVAVLVLGVFAVAKFTPVRGVFLRSFAAPKKYYHYVEEASAKTTAGSVASAYDNLIKSTIASDDQAMEGSLTLELGGKGRELAVDLLGDSLNTFNAGEDLSWLKNGAIDYSFNHKGDLGSMNAQLLFNGTGIASMDCVYDFESGKAWLTVPELSDRYVETTLEDLNSRSTLFSMIASSDMNSMDPVLQALPDAGTAEKLLRKYMEAVADCIDDVEKSKDQLSVGGVTAEYTVLTATIDGEAAKKIVETVGPMLRDDKDVKKLIIDITDAEGKDGEKSYDEFVKSLDKTIDSANQLPQNMKENLVMTVFVDGSDEVAGRIIEVGKDTKLEYLMPEKGGKFGLRVSRTQNGQEQFLLEGNGKRNGNKLTGSMELTVNGNVVGTVGLDEFDDEKSKEGCFLGGITFAPSKDMLDAMPSGMPESLKSILDDLVIRFDMDTAKSKENIVMSLLSNKEKLISLSLNNAFTGSKPVSKVSNGVETGEWAADITLDKLEKIVDSLEKAGIPEAYTDMLDQMLENYVG